MTAYKEVQTYYRTASLSDPTFLSSVSQFLPSSTPQTLSNHPGFLYYSSSLTQASQLRLAHRCLTEYCSEPHDTNIANVPPKPSETNLANAMFGHLLSPPSIFSLHYYRLSKLSWATMGYLYDWTARSYTESAKSPYPPALRDLAHVYLPPSYSPQASIINYYTPKSLMGGHLDDLELTLTPPVLSVSLGLPAIFLLGGATKDVKPTSILVRPGDVMVMGGESRRAYHGVARVLEGGGWGWGGVERGGDDVEFDSGAAEIAQEEQEAVVEYLKTHRVNVNIRQVLPDGVETIDELDRGS